jgi:hypothetical protein
MLLYVCDDCGKWHMLASTNEVPEDVLCPRCFSTMCQVQENQELVVVEQGKIENMKRYFRQVFDKK